MGATHHFVPNVKFSRLQRSLKKIHSEELDSGKDTASLWSERAIFRRKMLSERPVLWAIRPRSLNKIYFHNKISNKYKEFN